jgi:hypothetical protein
MTTLAKDTPRAYEVGEFDDVPAIAADIIYEGAAVGDNGSGYGRPLVAGDRFRGFATQQCDNSDGAAGDLNIRVRKRGCIQLSISGLVITDVGLPVYASDDNTFVLSPVGNTFIGTVLRFVSSGVGVVEFDTANPDPWALWPTRETISGAKTLDAQDTGKLFYVTATAVITLPATATAGANIAVVCGGADGTVQISLSPQAADKVMGPDLAGADDKDLINTLATARRGDFAVVSPGHADGWTVEALKGTWATEA